MASALVIKTALGQITLKLQPDAAPQTAEYITKLVKRCPRGEQARFQDECGRQAECSDWTLPGALIPLGIRCACVSNALAAGHRLTF